MRSPHPGPASLSSTEWAVVADALTVGGNDDCLLLDRVTRCVRQVLGVPSPARAATDPRTAAIRAFVSDTRRMGRPAEPIARSLMTHGFSPGQIAALAALSNH